MKPTVFVGQAPSSSSDPTDPLGGKSAIRLSMLLGITVEEFKRFERHNLNANYCGRIGGGKGDAFDRAEAEIKARELTSIIWRHECSKFVLLGAEVARAFGFAYRPLGRAESVRHSFLIFPHVSGIVRWWNDAEQTRRASETLKSFVNEE